jgi:uncharacterized membrane protein YkvA (DUF1232 family)
MATTFTQRAHGDPEPDVSVDELPLWRRLVLFWRLMRDPRVASWAKGLVPLLTVLYILSPVDLVPDWLVGLGQIDDAGVLVVALLVAMRMLRALSPEWVVREHLATIGAHRPSSSAGVPDRGATGEIIDVPFRDSAELQATGRQGVRDA